VGSGSTTSREEIEEIFEEALEQPEAELAAWLESACGGNPKLLPEVQALLPAHELAERADGQSRRRLRWIGGSHLRRI
jgi:hypothetical protein